MMMTMTMLRDKKICPPPSPYPSSGTSPPPPSLSAVALCIRLACLPGLSFQKQTRRRRRLLDPLQWVFCNLHRILQKQQK